MKTKELKISIFLLIALALSVLGINIFVANRTTVYAVSSQDSYCILQGDGSFTKNSTAVGSVSGYGEIILGESARLTATANAGYCFAGWLLKYDEQNSEDTFIPASQTQYTIYDANNIAIDLLISSSDSDFDGKLDSSILDIQKVFENLTIEPVFDYIYYNVDVSDMVKYIASDSQILNGTQIFYREFDSQNQEFLDSYYEKSGKYCYLGTIREVEVSGSNVYYVVNNKGSVERLVELDKALSYGVFNLSEQINLSFEIDVDENLSGNIVDVQGFTLSSTSKMLSFDSEGECVFEIEKNSAYGNTTAFNLKFDIIQDRLQTNKILINIENIYKLDFNITVDGAAPENYTVKHYSNVELNGVTYDDLYERDGEFFVEIVNNNRVYKHLVSVDSTNLGSYVEEYRNDKDLIESNFSANGAEFCKINNASYLVKNIKSSNVAFMLNLPKNITEDIDGTTFYYYGLKDGLSTVLSFENVSSNQVVEIDYISTNYEINYSFALLIDGVVTDAQTDLELPTTLSLVRGESVNLTQANAPVYSGYTFKGYSFGTSLNEEINYKINYLDPNGRTIYLCYQKIEYTLKLTNYNKISLGEYENQYYPINNIVISYTKNGSNINYRLSGSSLQDEVYTFSVKFTIGDSLLFTVTENSGFVVPGFKFQLSDDNIVNQFVIDKDFIDEYVGLNNEILLNVIEEYASYTITYTIDTAINQLNEEVIMAIISAQANGATIIEYNKDGDDVSTIDASDPDYETKSQVVRIDVSNLKYGDKVYLESTGKQLSGGTQFYAFNFFTEDGKAQLSIEEPVVELTGEITYTHIETVARNREIKVIYSMPTSKVNILIADDAAFDYSLESFTLTQDGIEKEIQNDQGLLSCEVDVGKTIVLTVDKTKVHFGYVLSGYSLLSGITQISGSTNEDDLTSQFTFTSTDNVQNLTINFGKVKYHFIIKEYGAGKNGEAVQVGINSYFELDVENRTIEFKKPTKGYYVSSANFASASESPTNVSIENMAESNETRNDLDIETYNFNFDYQTFVNIVSYFAQQTADSETVNVEINFNYSIYTYKIAVSYGLTNSKGSAFDSRVNSLYPSITLTYGTTTLQGISSGTNLTFVGVPYGESVRLNVANSVVNGFSVYGWTYSNGSKIESEYLNSSTFIYLENVTTDYNFGYKLTYMAYTIQLLANVNEGTPIIYINNLQVSDLTNIQITQFDNLRIIANANRTNGFEFKSITYKGRVVEYDDLTSSFETKVKDVVVYDNQFEVDVFDVSNYYVSDKNSIVFTFEYDLLQIKISNATKDFSNVRYSGSLRAGRMEKYAISIPLEEYANYEMIATDSKSGVRRTLLAEDEITINDIVEITIKINKEAIDNVTGYVYDLTNGLSLYEIRTANLNHNWSQISTGIYYLRFYLSEIVDGEYIIDNIPISNILEIGYGYIVLNKTLNVTTNINSVDFYKNIGMSINQVAYGFGSGIPASSQSSSVSSTMQFLATGGVGYNLLGYEPYFKITSINAKVGGGTIPSDLYSDYGIKLYTVNADGQTVERTRENDIITLIEVKYFNNLDLVLELQPIIYFGGYEVTTASKVFDRAFDCDENGNAKLQKLTLGENKNTADIAAFIDVVNSMQITYKNANGEIVEGVTDAGMYSVGITFENTDEYDWLSQLSLPYQIYVNVTPKDIYISALKNVTIMEKEYDGQETASKVDLMPYLVIKDNFGLEIQYITSYNNNGFSLRDGYYITQTREINGVQVPSKNASEGLYNLYIQNLRLANNRFNQNFNLKNSDLVLENCFKINKREIKIVGIDVYDKIYDGNTIATITDTSIPSILNKISGDVVNVDITKIIVRFNSSSVGGNKLIEVNFDNAVVGEDSSNYYYNSSVLTGKKIYPSELSTNIDGVGEITLRNILGSTDKTKVDLIPIGAKLEVKIIKAETAEYADIYSTINRYLVGTNTFALGYKLSLSVNGEQQKLSNDLELSLPKVNDLTNVVFLTKDRTGVAKYEVKENRIIVSLNSFEEEIDTIFLTQRRILLKLWQIILIAVAGAALVITVVVTVVVLRRKKLKEYSINEKI